MNSAADYRRDAWITALVLAAILIAVFSPFLLGNKSLMSSAGDVPSLYVEGAAPGPSSGHLRSLDPGAAGWQTESAFGLSHHIMFEEHRLPFWDPDGGYGKPSLGAMVPQQFYPLSTIVTLHPSPRVYAWWVAARLFVAGFFAALFVRLFFASRWAGLSAGIAATFTGYYLLYYDMPHLSVEVVLPMLLWATEIVSRKISARRFAALGAAIALVILGGMPESAFLALTVSSLYAALRVASLPGQRAKRVIAIVGAYVLGLAIGSIEFVPFLEFIHVGASTHDAAVKQGLGYDGAWRNGLLTELFPRVFGSPVESILQSGSAWSGIRGFFGVAGFFLGMVALCSAWLKRDSRSVIVTFLALLAAYSILKRFGNPMVNWTGALPFFVQIQFSKYIEAILGCAVTLLVGFGVGYLRERRQDVRGIWIAFTVTIALVTMLFLNTRSSVPNTPAASLYPHSLLFGLLFLFALAIAAYGITMQNARLRFLGSATVLAILVLEPFVTYLYPVVFRYAPPIGRDPYGGAPYISYLQQHMAPDHERLFGINAIFFPNWPSAYNLADTRSIEAVTLHDYLPFVDAFVATKPAISGDQVDRFVATAPIDMESSLVHRWLTLSSVGYVISPDVGSMMVAPKNSVLDQLMDQLTPTIADADRAALHRQTLEVDGIAEGALFEHPPREVGFRTDVPAAAPRLVADLALDPATYKPTLMCGGAVTFTLRALQDGNLIASASRTIDPKHLVADRHWIPLSIDLTKSSGHVVDVRFQTSAADTCAAWALWGEPRFVAANVRPSARHNTSIFPQVYSAPGVAIFRVPNSLSRLTLYHRARSAGSFNDAIAALTSPTFNVRNEVVLEGALPQLAPPTGHDDVAITSMRSDEVTATVDAGSDGLLMQNDAWYPGWKATVDERDVPIMRADGFFRGIPVDAGRHTVVISYASKIALLGSVLSLFGAIVLIALLADPIPLLRRKQPAA